MCTRYYIDKDEPMMADIVESALKSKLAEKFQFGMSKLLVRAGEVRPTDVAPVIAPNKKGEREIYPMKWGFTVTVDGKQKPVVNARIETASIKSLFSEAWQKHRCIIPASWYFEWEHFKDENGNVKTGSRYVIQPSNSTITWLCGLYRIEDGYPVFAIITKVSTEELSAIHDRMPLMLPEDKINNWINPDSSPDTVIPYALSDMVTENSKSSY